MAFLKKQTFVNDYKSLPEDIQLACNEALRKLATNPRAGSLRLHKLNGYSNPNVFTIDVTTNKAYKLSYEKGENGNILLRRVGTHKLLNKVA